jgi:hypothetical protein
MHSFPKLGVLLVKNLLKKGAVALSGAMALAVGSAHAAVDLTAVDTVTADITTAATDLFGKFIPVLGVIVTFGIVMSLIKRFASKAS